jgi:hypothetical protein
MNRYADQHVDDDREAWRLLALPSANRLLSTDAAILDRSEWRTACSLERTLVAHRRRAALREVQGQRLPSRSWVNSGVGFSAVESGEDSRRGDDCVIRSRGVLGLRLFGSSNPCVTRSAGRGLFAFPCKAPTRPALATRTERGFVAKQPPALPAGRAFPDRADAERTLSSWAGEHGWAARVLDWLHIDPASSRESGLILDRGHFAHGLARMRPAGRDSCPGKEHERPENQQSTDDPVATHTVPVNGRRRQITQSQTRVIYLVEPSGDKDRSHNEAQHRHAAERLVHPRIMTEVRA